MQTWHKLPGKRALLFALGFGAALPFYFFTVEKRDAASLCLSFACFGLYVTALLRGLLYPKPFCGQREEEGSERARFLRVCAGSLCWTLGLWLCIALGIVLFRHPDLPFWDALYADLAVNLDTRHYLNIAENGYVPEVNIDSQYIIVFFPLFPWLTRFLSFGGSLFITASLLSLLFAALSGPVLYRLVRLDYPARDAARAVRYLYLFPFALFLVTPMTESLFLLLCLLYVYCLRSGKWGWLLPLGLAAALCRMQGILLAAAAGVEYLGYLLAWLREKKRELRSFLKLAGKALYAAAGLLGGLGIYLAVNQYYYGDAFLFLAVQKSHWSQSLGFFFNTPAYMRESILRWFPERLSTILGTSIPNLLTIFGVLLIFVLGGRRIRPSYLCYALAYYAITIGATWLLSAPRYMAVLFPLPLAMAALTEDVWIDRFVSLVWGLLFALYVCLFVLKFPIY